MPGKKGKVFPTSLEQLLKVTDPSTHKELRKRAENPISTLAVNLKKMREEKGFSQKQVAEMADLGVMGLERQYPKATHTAEHCQSFQGPCLRTVPLETSQTKPCADVTARGFFVCNFY